MIAVSDSATNPVPLHVQYSSLDHISACINMFLSTYVSTGPPALEVDIVENATDLSTIVQWDEVDDSLPTNYTVTWTSDGITPLQPITLIEQSYIITGLILDTVYNISVFAANDCGQGPAFMTSVLFPTGMYVCTYVLVYHFIISSVSLVYIICSK